MPTLLGDGSSAATRTCVVSASFQPFLDVSNELFLEAPQTPRGTFNDVASSFGTVVRRGGLWHHLSMAFSTLRSMRTVLAPKVTMALLLVTQMAVADRFDGPPGARCSTLCPDAQKKAAILCRADGKTASYGTCTCNDSARIPYADLQYTCNTALTPAETKPSTNRAALRGSSFLSKVVAGTPITFFVRWEVDTLLGEPTVYCDTAWFLANDAPLPGGGTVAELAPDARKDLVLTDVDLAIELTRGKTSLGTVSCDAGALRRPILLDRRETPETRWRAMTDREKEVQLSSNVKSSPSWASTLESGAGFVPTVAARDALATTQSSTARIKSAQGVLQALQLQRAKREGGLEIPPPTSLGRVEDPGSGLTHIVDPPPKRALTPADEAAMAKARKDVATYEAAIAAAKKTVAIRESLKSATIVVDPPIHPTPSRPFTFSGKLRGIETAAQVQIEVAGGSNRQTVTPKGNEFQTNLILPRGRHTVLVRAKVEGATILRRVDVSVEP